MAITLGYYTMGVWLENFAYRITLSPWMIIQVILFCGRLSNYQLSIVTGCDEQSG